MKGTSCMKSGIVGLKTQIGYLCQNIETGEISELSEKEFLKHKLFGDSVIIFKKDTGIINWTQWGTSCWHLFIVDKNGTIIKFSVHQDDVKMYFLRVDVLNGRKVEMCFGDEYHIKEVDSAKSMSLCSIFLTTKASERLADDYIVCGYADVGNISYIKINSSISSYYIELITKDGILTGLSFSKSLKMSEIKKVD